MTLQEIFDKVSLHLKTQKCRSVNKVTRYCLYRGMNGTSCAVGCLIPDKDYHCSMEYKNIRNIEVLQEILGEDQYSIKLHLLDKLQYLHDYLSPEEWDDELPLIANQFKLNSK